MLQQVVAFLDPNQVLIFCRCLSSPTLVDDPQVLCKLFILDRICRLSMAGHDSPRLDLALSNASSKYSFEEKVANL
jgi:hypothetical protein